MKALISKIRRNAAMATDTDLKVYDRALSTVSTIALIIGGIWSLNGFMQAHNKENNLRQQQIKLAIFNDKKAVYYDLVDAESEIASCNTYDEVIVAQKHFRKLYVGRAHIIAGLDKDVNIQKIAFNKLLDKYLKEKPAKTPFNYFAIQTLKLGDICKKNLDITTIFEN